jgi:hypothetical protein
LNPIPNPKFLAMTRSPRLVAVRRRRESTPFLALGTLPVIHPGRRAEIVAAASVFVKLNSQARTHPGARQLLRLLVRRGNRQ